MLIMYWCFQEDKLWEQERIGQNLEFLWEVTCVLFWSFDLIVYLINNLIEYILTGTMDSNQELSYHLNYSKQVIQQRWSFVNALLYLAWTPFGFFFEVPYALFYIFLYIYALLFVVFLMWLLFLLYNNICWIKLFSNYGHVSSTFNAQLISSNPLIHIFIYLFIFTYKNSIFYLLFLHISLDTYC